MSRTSRWASASVMTTAAIVVLATSPPALARPAAPARGIADVIPITQVLAYGQKVTAVAVEYSAEVNPHRIGEDTFSVSDSLYNFRFNPVGDITDPTKRGERTVTAVYTNDEPTTSEDQVSEPGRYVIIELDPMDTAGSTVMAWLGGVKVNEDLQTQVVQEEDVYAAKARGNGRGPLLAAGSSTAHEPTQPAVNLLVDDFVHERFTGSTGTELPYAYHLPEDYDPGRAYPLVVVLPGQGMGFRSDATGTNEGVQVAADIPAVAWQQEEWTGTDEDVVVIAPQNRRVGSPSAQANLVVELLAEFTTEVSVDQDRIYASTVSYGSTLAWAALVEHPGLFDAALITGGFGATQAQADAIAASATPVYITHGTYDHLLNVVTTGQASYNRIWNAYVAQGKTPAQVNELVRYTEYGPEDFYEPDPHLAAAPTYEDERILQWLLEQ